MEFKPHKLAEANIQAEFYSACKLANIPCFLEYTSRWNGQKGCRFDAVIHDHKEIKAIVEIKSFKDPDRAKDYPFEWFIGKTCKKYSQFGVPVYLVTSSEDIKTVLSKLAERTYGDRCGESINLSLGVNTL